MHKQFIRYNESEPYVDTTKPGEEVYVTPQRSVYDVSASRWFI
jgi:hypothetical protein